MNEQNIFIGDIHGHALSLEKILHALGFKKINGAYRHRSGHKIYFAGDFIDRGPEIRKTLDLVKSMCDAGTAKAVIGNHEYNAVCFHTTDKTGAPLRAHSSKNIHQHQRTIDEFKNSQHDWKEYLEWFKNLPVFIEENGFRLVHAQWKQKHVDHLRCFEKQNLSQENILFPSAIKKTKEYFALEELLKGEEQALKIPFTDKDGNERFDYRIKWWKNTENISARDYYFEFPPLKENFLVKEKNVGYPAHEKPVFFGHYWLKANAPHLMGNNVCCLDFSVAKNGLLAAYRWKGEQKLNAENFVWV